MEHRIHKGHFENVVCTHARMHVCTSKGQRTEQDKEEKTTKMRRIKQAFWCSRSTQMSNRFLWR